MTKTAYHHGDLPSALIASALELAEEVGVQALTLRAVARRAGVSHAAPYRHYADKTALLAAVAEQGFGQLAECMDTAWATHRRRAFPERVTALTHAYVTFASERPAAFRIMFGQELAELAQVPAKFPALQTAVARAFGVVHGAVVQGQDGGAFAAGAPALELAQAVWASAHGVACLVLDRRLDAAAAPGILRWHSAGLGAEGV